MKQREGIVDGVKYVRVNRVKAEKIWNRDKGLFVTAIYEQFPNDWYGSKDYVRRNPAEDNFTHMVSRHITNSEFCFPDVGMDLSYYVKEEDLKQLEQEMNRNGFSECEEIREERRKMVMGVHKVVLGNQVEEGVYEALFLDKNNVPFRIPQKGGNSYVQYDGNNLEIPFLYRSATGASYNLTVDKKGTEVDDRFVDKHMVLLNSSARDVKNTCDVFRCMVKDVVKGEVTLPTGENVIVQGLYDKIGKVVKEKSLPSVIDKDEYVYIEGNVRETLLFMETLKNIRSLKVDTYVRSDALRALRESRSEFLLYGMDASKFVLYNELNKSKEKSLLEAKRFGHDVSKINESYQKVMDVFENAFERKIVNMVVDTKKVSRKKSK